MTGFVAVSQRVVIVPGTNERRDALDQRWTSFLARCDVLPLLIPNRPETALALVASVRPIGILLTGGNDLAALGGDAPERDRTERALLEYALSASLPLLGVCRGMQVIQDFFGVPLKRVEGHVCQAVSIRVNGQPAEVNSYHRWGSTETRPPLDVWAVAPDGVIKAVGHENGRIQGIMWHPERNVSPSESDIALVKGLFR